MIVIGNDKDDKFCLTRISPWEVIISEKSKAVNIAYQFLGCERNDRIKQSVCKICKKLISSQY